MEHVRIVSRVVPKHLRVRVRVRVRVIIHLRSLRADFSAGTGFSDFRLAPSAAAPTPGATPPPAASRSDWSRRGDW